MAYAPTRYDALIIDPDIDTRMRLKTATSAVVSFHRTNLVTSLEEGEKFLNNAQSPIDVIFISYKIDHSQVAGFIKSSKNLKAAQDAAYILVLSGKDQESSTVAQNVMIGADGFLFEPYSVESLTEITELASKVRKERRKDREKAALSFLIDDIIRQLDLISYLKSKGYDVGRGIKSFKKMCAVFQTLEKESLDLYFELCVEKFSNAPFPDKIYNQSYKGASKRIKERMEKKMLAEIEKGLVESEGEATA